MKKRNLDPCFFNIERDTDIQRICFSDLTTAERDELIKNYSADELKSICNKLADALSYIGDIYDIEFKELVEN